MPDIKGFWTIRQVVYSALNRSRDDEKYFLQYAIIACECLAELNIFHTTHFRVAYIPVSNINVCNLPEDYIDYVTPPAMILNNCIYPLTEDNKIPMNNKIDCGNPLNPQPTGNTIPHYHEFWYNTHYGKIIDGCPAYYRIDKQSRLIRLRGNIIGGEVYLEYKSTGISVDSETIIPREVVPAIRQYLLWQSIENDLGVPMNEKERKKEQYEDQLELLVHFQQSFTLDEFLHLMRSTYSQGVKR